MILSQTQSRPPGTRARRAPLPPPVPSRLRLDGHIPALDAVRGLAILMVMAYHFNPRLTNAPGSGRTLVTLFNLGGCGVDLFFVLSGFLITGILFDAKGSMGYFRNFYIRGNCESSPCITVRWSRAFVLLAVPYPHSGASRGGPKYRTAPVLALGLHGATCCSAWKGSYVLGWFSHFWSLAGRGAFLPGLATR